MGELSIKTNFKLYSRQHRGKNLPREALFVTATKKFLHEIGPLLREIGYDVVDRQNADTPKQVWKRLKKNYSS